MGRRLWRRLRMCLWLSALMTTLPPPIVERDADDFNDDGQVDELLKLRPDAPVQKRDDGSKVRRGKIPSVPFESAKDYQAPPSRKMRRGRRSVL